MIPWKYNKLFMIVVKKLHISRKLGYRFQAEIMFCVAEISKLDTNKSTLPVIVFVCKLNLIIGNIHQNQMKVIKITHDHMMLYRVRGS